MCNVWSFVNEGFSNRNKTQDASKKKTAKKTENKENIVVWSIVSKCPIKNGSSHTTDGNKAFLSWYVQYLITWGKAVFANVSNWGAKECWETDFLFEKSHQLKICQLKIAKNNDKMYLTLNCVLLHLLKYLTWDTWSAEQRYTDFKLVLNQP